MFKRFIATVREVPRVLDQINSRRLKIHNNTHQEQPTMYLSVRSDTNRTKVTASSVSTPPQNDVLVHPPRRKILKRIPKGARPAAANLLQKLINDVLRHSSSSSSPLSLSSRSRLLGYSTSCLVKPARGGKSRNLTTSVVNQLRQYELGTNHGLNG